jgi:hypothetical protein
MWVHVIEVSVVVSAAVLLAYVVQFGWRELGEIKKLRR